MVVDIDPVHVVSGKPRPQLLPEPMALVAYIPVVEVVDKEQNGRRLAETLVRADKPYPQKPDDEAEWLAQRAFKVDEVEALLKERMFSSGAAPHCKDHFNDAYEKLKAVRLGKTDDAKYVALVDVFSKFFGDPKAVCERFNAWHQDRHQQPSSKVGGSKGYEPAWLDFLIADLTYDGGLPKLEVPAWCAPNTDD